MFQSLLKSVDFLFQLNMLQTSIHFTKKPPLCFDLVNYSLLKFDSSPTDSVVFSADIENWKN